MQDTANRWALQLKAGVNFETAAQHVLQVTATANGVTSAVQDITINVTDADDVPGSIHLNGSTVVSIGEHALIGTVLGILSATDQDGDAITGYALAQNSDFFEIVQNGANWEVRLKAAVDFETAAQSILYVTATANGLTSAIQEITIDVTDADDAPGGILVDGATTADLTENALVGSIVGTLTAVDADGDAITGYALAQPSALLKIVQNQAGDWLVKLKAGVDFEDGGPARPACHRHGQWRDLGRAGHHHQHR